MAKKKPKPVDAKKKKPKVREIEDDLDDELDDDEADDSEPKPPSRNNIYVGLGGITLIALIASAALFYTDAEATGKKQVPRLTVDVGELREQAAP